MKSIYKRCLLIFLFMVNLSTLLLDWQVIEGMTTRNGFIILTSNILLSGFILFVYLFSLILYPKAKIRFFVSGICSLSMLAALEFSKFEAYGRFNNTCIGVYLGLLTILINIVIFVLLLEKEAFSEKAAE